MARTIQEIDLPRQRVGACDVMVKVLVEEPVGASHDPIVAAEAAGLAREIEEAIVSVLAGHLKRGAQGNASTSPPPPPDLAGIDGLLKEPRSNP